MKFDPEKHEIITQGNASNIRCKTCNKYYDRCICGKEKGEKDGLCNRSACLSPINVKWYNHSTRKYYCTSCAHELNDDPYNARDAERLWGHELCTYEEDEKEKEDV